jgi:LacI family transcriptional regulator
MGGNYERFRGVSLKFMASMQKSRKAPAARVRAKPRRVALMVESAVAPRRRMLAGVARYIHEHEPWAVYLKPFGVEKSLDRWLREWKGDGIIAAVAELETDIVRDFGIPVVDVVGLLRHPEIPLVHANDHSIGRIGAEHLLERGYGHFGFVEYPYFWSIDRRAGFEAALSAEGAKASVFRLPFPAAGQGGPSYWEAQQQNLEEWVRSLPKPVGVMTSTDLAGQQLLEACLRADMAVPEQVAVVGADNDELICNLCCPPLSSVIINDEQRGYHAAAVLDHLMSGRPAPRETVYIEPSSVVSRASTDILAVDDQAVAEALRFIRDHACESIGVREVARTVPTCRRVLERRFQKVVGRSINDEIVRVRLNHAVELLCSTRLELKDIARKAGFGSPSYMGAVFQQKLGCTPGSYRGRGAGAALRHAGQTTLGPTSTTATTTSANDRSSLPQ